MLINFFGSVDSRGQNAAQTETKVVARTRCSNYSVPRRCVPTTCVSSVMSLSVCSPDELVRRADVIPSRPCTFEYSYDGVLFYFLKYGIVFVRVRDEDPRVSPLLPLLLAQYSTSTRTRPMRTARPRRGPDPTCGMLRDESSTATVDPPEKHPKDIGRFLRILRL